MTLLTRTAAAPADSEASRLVLALLSTVGRPAPRTLPDAVATPAGPTAPTDPVPAGSTGSTGSTPGPLPPAPAPLPPTASADWMLPAGLGTSALRIPTPAPPATTGAAGPPGVPELYCPPALRDDRALGEEVNARLVEWAGEVGIYPGQLDRVAACDFGRLIMLAHPESDDADRLLAAAKCALAEWSVDDHYVDGEAEQAVPERLGQRLAIAYTAIDPAHLPEPYASQLDEHRRGDPVMVALRDSLDNLSRYATAAQVARLRHELSVMFVAYNQEAVWRTTEQMPPVWEYLLHRHENSFLPCMVLIDPVAGYELPAAEFADPRVRRAFTLAGTASVLVNDLYSMAKEDPTDTNLPRVLAAEQHCSLTEAVERSAAIHDELMHTFESEAAVLSLAGSPALRRFLAGLWAWLGGSREWHASTARYHGADAAPTTEQTGATR
ncbi:family 2 encapsulin nanocompartment cargo protein terpene cyclase [Actinocatenispora comari]|uniref:Terpene synthase n=1 Tax=Actinocatenispora comari TaxID=2807577 RepID=A0A8J4A9L3_9ACTN|nr:family 2 encapsulin nanocompartment cargo protein terpene cyclase [Actinocatenispora comari]GIL27301.1 terpene synthase [Actinocatenispora comari]